MSTAFTHTLISLGLCCTFAATAAFAAPDRQTALVRTADLDLATAAGQQALRSRIAHAVSFVSGPVDPRDLTAMAAVNATRRSAMASAVRQIEVATGNAQGGKAYAANDAKLAPSGS